MKKTKYRTFDEVYENYEGRNNILRVLSIKKGSNILYLGNNKAHIRFLSKLGNLKVCENFEAARELNENFDVIIVDRLFDTITWNEKLEWLGFLKKIKKHSGHIYLFANNKLAIRYFSGTYEEGSTIPFGNLLESNHLLSYKEWKQLIKSMNEEYKFYFPYPDLDFVNVIYTKDPKLGQIPNAETLFKDYRLILFNDVQALNEINKSGYFKDFSNCFLIEIGTPSSIEMVKFSQERKEIYQMMTWILQKKNEKIVEKKCLYPAGISHLDKIEEYYHRFNSYNKNPNIAYCDLKRKSRNVLQFQYIIGENLEEKVEIAVQKNDIYKIKEYLKIIDELASVGSQTSFSPNQRFFEVFGERDYSLLEKQECFDVANIDLIFGNVICNDKYYAIDYEWVFDCTIPKSYIMFRTLFHSYGLSQLKKEDLDTLYELYGINDALKEIYLNMEIHFQEYVSDSKLSDILKEYHLLKLFPEEIERRMRRFEIHQNNQITTYCSDTLPTLDIQFDIEPNQNIDLIIHGKCILEIRHLMVDGKEVSFMTNAALIDGKTYYFINDPQIHIEAQNGNKLSIEGYFYLFNDGNVDRMVELMNLCDELSKRNQALENHLLYRISHKLARLFGSGKK